MAQNITEGCREKYVLQGGSLAAKTQILEKLTESAVSRGHRVTVYHMPLDPRQLQMVLLPDLGVAMLTEELLGKDYTLQERDIPLSLTAAKKEMLPSGEDEIGQSKEERYESHIAQAVENLKKAKSRHDDLEAFYCQAMDYERIDTARNKIFNRILALAAEKEKGQK